MSAQRFVLAIAGEPQPQQRHRVASWGGRARMYDPEESVAWKRTAAATMRLALSTQRLQAPLFKDVPLELHVLALFSCPKSHHRKREPLPRRPLLEETYGDVDNLAKAVMDAGNGLLWPDDAQVVRLVSEKLYAAQGEPPRVLLMVRPLPLELWTELRRLATLEAEAQGDLAGAECPHGIEAGTPCARCEPCTPETPCRTCTRCTRQRPVAESRQP